MAIVPALNEAGTIAQVVTGMRNRITRVVVVDDGSSDATADLARTAGAMVIAHSEPKGKGQAVRTGLAHVLAQPDIELVLILDGDMQHLPEEAGHLIDTAVATGADLVVGERQFDRATMPAVPVLRQSLRQRGVVVVHWRAAEGYAVRLSSVPRRHAAPTAPARDRLRHRN